MECAFSVWSKPWEDFREVTMKGCRTVDKVEKNGSLSCGGTNKVRKRDTEAVQAVSK